MGALNQRGSDRHRMMKKRSVAMGTGAAVEQTTNESSIFQTTREFIK